MQANPTIIWPGAIIDWAGRMAPFSQDANLTLAAWAIAADLGVNRWTTIGSTARGGFCYCLVQVYWYTGGLEVSEGWKAEGLDCVS